MGINTDIDMPNSEVPLGLKRLYAYGDHIKDYIREFVKVVSKPLKDSHSGELDNRFKTGKFEILLNSNKFGNEYSGGLENCLSKANKKGKEGTGAMEIMYHELTHAINSLFHSMAVDKHLDESVAMLYGGFLTIYTKLENEYSAWDNLGKAIQINLKDWKALGIPPNLHPNFKETQRLYKFITENGYKPEDLIFSNFLEQDGKEFKRYDLNNLFQN